MFVLDYVLKAFFIFLIRVYKVIGSPLFRLSGGQCRFYPDCSTYGLEAVKTHGGVKGGWLALKRVLKCGPFHPGGLDPVPPKSDTNTGVCNKCLSQHKG